MNVLVTGGAGFIGSHVANIMLEAGHNVVIVDNLYTGHRHNVPDNAKFYEADITDFEQMEQVFSAEGIDAISHQAALANVRDSMKEPLQYAKVNLLGSLTLLEMARKYGVKKIVFASTGGATYGEGYSESGDRLPFTEQSWPVPKDNYGANKLSVEHHLDLYYYAYGLKYAALRYPNVYGPRQDCKGEAGVVAIFAGVRGHLDGIAINDVNRFESQFLDHVRDTHADILTDIRDSGALSDETEKKLEEAASAFVKTFA